MSVRRRLQFEFVSITHPNEATVLRNRTAVCSRAATKPSKILDDGLIIIPTPIRASTAREAEQQLPTSPSKLVVQKTSQKRDEHSRNSSLVQNAIWVDESRNSQNSTKVRNPPQLTESYLMTALVPRLSRSIDDALSDPFQSYALPSSPNLDRWVYICTAIRRTRLVVATAKNLIVDMKRFTSKSSFNLPGHMP